MEADLDSLISGHLCKELICDMLSQYIINVKEYVLAIVVIHQESIVLAGEKEL